MIRAVAVYRYQYASGESDMLIVDVSTDATYTPDLLSDLAGKAKSTLAETVLETWPPVAVEPP